MGDELIFAVDRSVLFDGAWPQGFHPIVPPGGGEDLLGLLASRGRFVHRRRAERDPALKQPIPYCAVLWQGDILIVERLQTQSEGRLHGLLSVGIGGHVEPVDRLEGELGPELFRRALERELHEELLLPNPLPHRPRLLGLINDDSDAVGQVHVGLAYLYECPGASPNSSQPLSQERLSRIERAPEVRETAKMRGLFRSLAGSSPLWQDQARFESWSRILLQALKAR